MQVVYPKLKFILCIDSLHFSNVDEVNWIWLDFMWSTGTQLNLFISSRMYLCSESYNQSSLQISPCEWKYYDSVNMYKYNLTRHLKFIIVIARRMLQFRRIQMTVGHLCVL